MRRASRSFLSNPEEADPSAFTRRVTFAFAGLCFFIILFTVPETYSPKILASKAAARRKATGESRWYAPLERQSVRWQDRVQNILVKPFAMLFKEPMLLSVTLYMSFVCESAPFRLISHST